MLVATVLGCDRNSVPDPGSIEPISAEEASQLVTERLKDHASTLRGLSASLDSGWAAMLRMMGSRCLADDPEGPALTEQSAREAVDWLRDHVFVANNGEEIADGSVRFSAVALCDGEATCERRLREGGWHLRVTRPVSKDPGHVTIFIKSERDEKTAFSLSLGRKRITTTWDLSSLTRLADAGRAASSEHPDLRVVEAAGLLALSVVLEDETSWEAKLSLLEDVRATLEHVDAPSVPYRLTMAARKWRDHAPSRLASSLEAGLSAESQPLSAFYDNASVVLRHREDASLVQVAVALDAIGLELPLTHNCEAFPCESAERLVVEVAELEGNISIDSIDGNLQLDGFTIGAKPMVARADEQELLVGHVNTDSGESLSARLHREDDGLHLSLQPKLDISMALKINSLLGEDGAPWLADQLFEVILDGAPRSELLIPAPPCEGGEASHFLFEMLTGRFVLRETARSEATRELLVEEGMCLLEASDEAESNAPSFFIDHLGSSLCK